MGLLAQGTDYTDKDFDSLRLRLQSLVRSVFPDWTDFNVANFGNILGPVLLAGLSWLSVKAAQLISVKVKNEQLKAVLLRLDDVVLAAVREAQQVLVDKLKATSADGALTPNQGAQAKQAAIDSAKSQLGATGLAEVGKTFGLEGAAVDKLLSTRVEAAVHRLKAQSRPLGSGTAGDAVPFAA